MDKRTLFAITAIVAGAVVVPPRLFGQTLSIGLIGGGGLTDAIQNVTIRDPGAPGDTRYWSQSKDWIAGAMAELRFHSGLSVEADCMYRELHATFATVGPGGTLLGVSAYPVVTWEFPVLAKYRFGVGALKPFLEAGPSFRTTGNLNFNPSHLGATAGLGVEARWRGLNIAPVLRYTRWAPDEYGLDVGAGSQRNQVELLVGVSRAAESLRNPLGRRISLGVVAGWGLTGDVSPHTYPVNYIYSGPGDTLNPVNGTTSVTGVKSVEIGPTMEVAVVQNLSVEVDALYKPLREHRRTVLDNGRVYAGTYTDAPTWRFPVLAKYRFPLAKVDPFVEAGPSFRLPQGSLSTHGVTAGAGVEMRLGALKIAPAVRFTHWGPDSGYGSGDARNEAYALVGFTLGGPPR